MKNFFAKYFKFNEYQIDFLKRSKLYYIISLIIIIPGLVIMLTMGLNLGIDFTGGSILKITYTEEVALEEVRDVVTTMVTQTPSVNESDANSFIIKTEELDTAQNKELQEALGELGAIDETMTSTDRIGPTIGAELLSNARWALLIAGVLMLVYITIRFKFKYAITAIIALAHDVLVLVSFFAIFRLEVDSAFIAAALTIVGYSINNTIVIFDRIRENSNYFSRKEFAPSINKSINQTLTRSINTVLTVLLLLFALLIFGGDTTKIFVLALIVGMFAGFYSSVFLVGNLLTFIDQKLDKKKNENKPQKPKTKAKAAPDKGN